MLIFSLSCSKFQQKQFDSRGYCTLKFLIQARRRSFQVCMTIYNCCKFVTINSLCCENTWPSNCVLEKEKYKPLSIANIWENFCGYFWKFFKHQWVDISCNLTLKGGLNLREAAVTNKNLRKGSFLRWEASLWVVLRPTRERERLRNICAYWCQSRWKGSICCCSTCNSQKRNWWRSCS